MIKLNFRLVYLIMVMLGKRKSKNISRMISREEISQ
mgnify:CR=1 FL=1